jgi:ribosomal protein L35
MKQKSHSGLKKRIKVRKSGSISVQKSCRNHLLTNKSKRQKKMGATGMAVHPTRVKAIRRLLPGKVK